MSRLKRHGMFIAVIYCLLYLLCITEYIVNLVSCRAEPKRNSNNNSMPVEVKKSPTYGRANGRTKVISGKKREPSLQLHPTKQSPPRTSPYDKASPLSTAANGYIVKYKFLITLKKRFICCFLLKLFYLYF